MGDGDFGVVTSEVCSYNTIEGPAGQYVWVQWNLFSKSQLSEEFEGQLFIVCHAFTVCNRTILAKGCPRAPPFISTEFFLGIGEYLFYLLRRWVVWLSVPGRRSVALSRAETLLIFPNAYSSLRKPMGRAQLLLRRDFPCDKLW